MPKSTMPRTRMKDTSAIDEMAKAYEAMLPKEFGGALNLFIHPMAGAAAMSAIGFGVASHAFGLWMGTVAGVAEASRQMLEPASESDRPAAAPKAAGGKPRLELVASDGVSGQADKMMRNAAVEAERASAENAASARKIAEDATRKAAATARKSAKAAAKPEATGRASGPSRPRALAKPDAVDDLKAISGVGPKLEQVLNKLGIWTYAQIAKLAEGEIAWLDEELGFAGRIGRDDWTGQARKLASAE